MNVKRVLCSTLAVVMAFSMFAGCGVSTDSTVSGTSQAAPEASQAAPEASQATGTGKVVELRFLSSQIGESTEAGWFSSMVDGFNTAHDGKIRISVDGVAGEAVNDKLRTDAAGNTMPDLFMLAADAARFNLIADSGRAVDLTPYLEANPELRDSIDKDSLAAYTDSQGHLLGLPYVKAYMGIYYNKSLFEAAGISEFPTTWDDFFVACDKLKASGVAPIAFMTGENSWTTMLMMSHVIGTTGGAEWLKSAPETANFNDPAFVKAAEMMQKMIAEYATADAVGATYAVAANNFNNGKAAMICNGSWMAADFINPDISMEELDGNVVYTLAPGGGAIQAENMSYAIGSKDQEHSDAAFEVLKYMTSSQVYIDYLNMTSGSPTLKIDESLLNIDPVIANFQPLAANAQVRYGQLSNCIKAACVDGLSQLLPDLASRRITAEQFAEQMQNISDSQS